jgi:site-specific recombinase XerD
MKVLPNKFKVLFSVLNGSGLRISELLSLKVNDIIFEGKTKGKICVRKGKGYKPGDAPEYSSLLDNITDMVSHYVKLEKKEPGDYIFTT